MKAILIFCSSLFAGGGTFIRCLRKTIMLRKGQVLVHPGDLYHKGVDITKGVRNLIVCFMDGFDPSVRDSSHSSDEKTEFESRICTC